MTHSSITFKAHNNNKNIALTITKPQKSVGEDEYYCNVSVKGITENKKIYGVDQNQAYQLSNKYILVLIEKHNLSLDPKDLQLLKDNAK